jgi:hypothetical protein
MYLTKLREALVRSRWPRTIAVALGVALLIPLPALALTFLGPWKVVQALTTHTAGAPEGILVDFTDVKRHGSVVGSSVIVNMGQSTAPIATSSTLAIQRTFRVDSPAGERLVVQGLINTFFKDASFSVNAQIGHKQGGAFKVDEQLALLSGSVGATPTTITRSGPLLKSKLLPQAGGRHYFVRLFFTFAKAPDGFWHDNSPTPASIHRFSRRFHRHV